MIMRTDGCRGMQPHRCLESASARDHDQSDPGSRWASAIPMSLLPSFASSASPLFRSRQRATIRWHTDGFDTEDAGVFTFGSLKSFAFRRALLSPVGGRTKTKIPRVAEVQTRENGGKRNRNETADRSNHGVHTGTTASSSALPRGQTHSGFSVAKRNESATVPFSRGRFTSNRNFHCLGSALNFTGPPFSGAIWVPNRSPIEFGARGGHPQRPRPID